MQQILSMLQNIAYNVRAALIVIVIIIGSAMVVTQWARTKQPGPPLTAGVVALGIALLVWKMPDLIYLMKNNADSITGGGGGYN
jgi:hypothetical protein